MGPGSALGRPLRPLVFPVYFNGFILQREALRKSHLSSLCQGPRGRERAAALARLRGFGCPGVSLRGCGQPWRLLRARTLAKEPFGQVAPILLVEKPLSPAPQELSASPGHRIPCPCSHASSPAAVAAEAPPTGARGGNPQTWLNSQGLCFSSILASPSLGLSFGCCQPVPS